mgnify:CR=1 FL=1
MEGEFIALPDDYIVENDIEYFFSHVNEMMNAVDNWNPPPLIIEYKDDGSFYVCDGRHRLEMFRQKEAKSAPAIVWATGKENFDRLKEINFNNNFEKLIFFF